MPLDYGLIDFQKTRIKCPCPGILHCPKTLPTLNSLSMPVNRNLVETTYRIRVRFPPTYSSPPYNNAHKRPNPTRFPTNFFSPPCHSMHSTSTRDARTPSARTMCMCGASPSPPKDPSPPGNPRKYTLPPQSASTPAESGCRMLRPRRAKIATPALGG